MDAGEHLVGYDVIDADGTKIGNVAHVYAGDGPGWIAVDDRLVPLQGSYLTDRNDLVVCVGKDVIDNAPHATGDKLPTDELAEYYADLVGTSSGYGKGWDEQGGQTTRGE